MRGARLELSKYKFGVRKIELLGHAIGPEGVQPSAGHLKTLQQLVEPAGGEESMRFFCPANYFSRFIDHFAVTSRPLYAVLKRHWIFKKE